MAGTFLAFIDESGQQHSDLCFVLASSIFDTYSFGKFDEDIWRMRADREIFPGKEVKLRRLLGKGGRAFQALDIWAELLRRTNFSWHAAIIQKKLVSNHEQEALKIIVNGLSSEMKTRDALVLPSMDEGHAHEEKRNLLYSIRHEGKITGVVGPINFSPSHHSVGLWVSDSIAYLLHQKINRSIWHNSYKLIWDILKEKVVRSPEGFILGYGVKFFPESEELEKEVLALF